MPDKFDPYREALVVEECTIWPDHLGELEAEEKRRFERSLHADPESAAALEYVRVYTGFCRQLTVTDEEFERIQATAE